jgi:Pin2-interacting protein X1
MKWLLTDTNKYGQQMLEKMGWKPGCGLGANEQGITEQIKVAYKNDKKCKYVRWSESDCLRAT